MEAPRPFSLSKTLALVPPAALLLAQNASGAFNAYIKIDDIEGESTDEKWPQWIIAESFNFRLVNEIVRSSGEAIVKKIKTLDLTITKPLDRSYPELFLGGATGSRYETVVLNLVRDGIASGAAFYRITLSDVLISSISTAAASGDDIPAESVSLNYGKIKIEYFLQDSKGGTTAIPPIEWTVTDVPKPIK